MTNCTLLSFPFSGCVICKFKILRYPWFRSRNSKEIPCSPDLIINVNFKCRLVWFGLWGLTPLSTIFQLYRGDQFYWWRKLECPEKTTDLPLFNFYLHKIVLQEVGGKSFLRENWFEMSDLFSSLMIFTIIKTILSTFIFKKFHKFQFS
jgi:hypothetical protein